MNRLTERLTRLEPASELTTIPKRGEPDREQRAGERSPIAIASPDGADVVAEEPDVRNGDDERAEPQRERREQLARDERAAIDGREEQALERAALALAADRVGRGEQGQQGADADRDLQREVDRLALLEEVERRVGGAQVGDHAQQQAEREAQTSPRPPIHRSRSSARTRPPTSTGGPCGPGSAIAPRDRHSAGLRSSPGRRRSAARPRARRRSSGIRPRRARAWRRSGSVASPSTRPAGRARRRASPAGRPRVDALHGRARRRATARRRSRMPRRGTRRRPPWARPRG